MDYGSRVLFPSCPVSCAVVLDSRKGVTQAFCKTGETHQIGLNLHKTNFHTENWLKRFCLWLAFRKFRLRLSTVLTLACFLFLMPSRWLSASYLRLGRDSYFNILSDAVFISAIRSLNNIPPAILTSPWNKVELQWKTLLTNEFKDRARLDETTNCSRKLCCRRWVVRQSVNQPFSHLGLRALTMP